MFLNFARLILVIFNKHINEGRNIPVSSAYPSCINPCCFLIQDDPQRLKLGLKKQLHCTADSNPATAISSRIQTKQDYAEGQYNTWCELKV